MIITTSVLADLLEAMPHLRQQVYFKSSLTALSHAMEDQVLAGAEQPLVIASFQRERFYRQEAHRYRRIAEQTSQVYVLAAPDADFKNSSDYYETVAFEPGDALSQEWHLVVIGQLYANCLICLERFAPTDSTNMEMDPSRRFEGIWTFDRNVSRKAADLLLTRIEAYRPELATKIAQAKSLYVGDLSLRRETVSPSLQDAPNPDPFVQRLVTYLQAGQYKLLKAYRSISAQEQKERLVNSITAAIRRSLNPDEILEVAVRELGQALESCRCLIYRCKATDAVATITHEFLKTGDSGEISLAPALGQTWSLQDNYLFQSVVQRRESIYVENTQAELCLNGTQELPKPKGELQGENSDSTTLSSTESREAELPRQRSMRRQRGQGSKSTSEELAERSSESRDSSSSLKNLVRQFCVRSLLMVPVLYQGRLLGMVELHHCGIMPYRWKEDELSLVEAIAT